MIAVSIVSHGHGAMVSRLVGELAKCPEVTRIILTLNIEEDVDVPEGDGLVLVRNSQAKGFGANHNAAFARCEQTYFCVLNPDVELRGNPFPGVLQAMARQDAALGAPAVLDAAGRPQDSMRHFPTIRALIAKAVRGDDGAYSLRPDVDFCPDWVAGMFMLFRTDDYACIGGFDPRFHLYYEDVDICARLWLANRRVVGTARVTVVHEAQRESWRRARFMRWHLASMVRYFVKHAGHLPRRGTCVG